MTADYFDLFKNTINAQQFRWIRGEELLSRYHSSEFVVKHFRSVCGSNLISTYDNEPEKIGVPLGGLDQTPHNAPEGHIYVGPKSPWFTLTDDLLQYDRQPCQSSRDPLSSL